MDNRVEQWINWIQYDEIIQGDSRGPQRLLGRHACGKGMIYILYRPEAKRAWLIREGKDEYPMNLIEDKGLFGVYLSDQDKNSYQYKIEYSSNDVITIYDPYTFGSEFGDLDKYLFAEGTHYEIYNKLGAHLKTIDGISGTLFTVWAPNA